LDTPVRDLPKRNALNGLRVIVVQSIYPCGVGLAGITLLGAGPADAAAGTIMGGLGVPLRRAFVKMITDEDETYLDPTRNDYLTVAVARRLAPRVHIVFRVDRELLPSRVHGGREPAHRRPAHGGAHRRDQDHRRSRYDGRRRPQPDRRQPSGAGASIPLGGARLGPARADKRGTGASGGAGHRSGLSPRHGPTVQA
jgi:hypothetical protein